MEALWDSAIVRLVATLVVPVAWGLLTAWLFDWLRTRRGRRSTGQAPQAPDVAGHGDAG